MPQRLTHEQVEEAFAAKKYRLLEQFTNSKTKMKAECPEGHQIQISWEIFKMGCGCKICGAKRTADKQRLSPEFVTQQIELEGYKLLTPYKSATELIEVVCDRGHQYTTTWARFKTGTRCNDCRGLQKHSNKADEVKAAFAAEGYQLLDEYKACNQKLGFICTQGHKHQISWRDWGCGKRCKFCATEIRASKRRLSHESVEAAITKEGYQLCDRYTANAVKMRMICPEKHEFMMNWADFNRNHRCPECMRVLVGKKRRRTHEYVAEQFAKAGYKLLDRYEDSHKKMRYICPNEHEHSINWTNFDQGYRCAHCAGQIVTHEQVEVAFSKAGYTLLDRYSSAHRRMRFICPQGHKYSMTWDNFNTGTRCAVCAGRVVTRKQVKEAFEAAGYQLLGKYKKNTTKLKFICPEGHEHLMTWADFRRGYRCAYCAGKFIDQEEVSAAFEASGYTLLSSYERSDIKLKFICPNKHEHSISWGSFKQGSRCAYCAGKILTHDEVELAFSTEGYTLLDRYVNSDTKMRYICPEGHHHSIIWDSFKQGARCAHCAGMHPTDEQRKINKIKIRIVSLVQIYLRKQSVVKNFSVSTLAGKVAKSIHETIGPRPEGHHLDHIVPQSYFDFRNQHEVEACWDLANLRYIPDSENISRGNRLTLKEVENFSDRQLEILASASRRPSKFNRYLKGLDNSHFEAIKMAPNSCTSTRLDRAVSSEASTHQEPIQLGLFE